RMVYDLNPVSEEFTDFNETLSNAFEVNSVKHIPNAGLNFEGEKLRIGFNVGLLNTSLETNNLLMDISFDNNYNNLYLNSTVRYEYKKGASLFFRYSNDTDIPSIRQLQPVPDVSNPLNIIVGNPELEPTFQQNFWLRLHNFDFASRTGIFANASLSFSENEVVPYTIIGEDLVRTTTYRNVDGGLNARIGGNYRKTIKKKETEFEFGLGTYANYRKEIGFTNAVLYNADSYRIYPGISLGLNYNDLLEIDLDYDLTYVYTNYDISNNREAEYLNHGISLESTSYWPKNWVFGNDISFNHYGNIPEGFDNTSLLWNMSLGYKFLDDDATIKLRVYDLLNENISTSRRAGQNFIQSETSLILEQYFMLSFTYKISKFGGKDPNESGNNIFID
ncbi:MAG TPA: outer membrane beta-barrel protein, partial [Salinimicrobium sp.]|nr:outer membrane beta-barrel protein [Salinimicrobium sp.]